MLVPRPPVSYRVLLLCWLFALYAAGHILFVVQDYDHIRTWYFWTLYAPAGLLFLGALLAIVIRAMWQRSWRTHVVSFLHLTLCLSLLWLAPKLGHQLYDLKENRTRSHARQVLDHIAAWKNTHGTYPPTLAHLDVRTPAFIHTFALLEYRRTSPTNYYFSAQGGRFFIDHQPDGTGRSGTMIVCH